MPVDLSWYISLRVVHIHVYDEVPIDVIRVLADRIVDYTQVGIAPIHFLLDDKDADPPPVNVKVLTNAYGVDIVNSELVGWVIGIGKPHAIAKIVIPLFMKVLKVKFLRVDTIEEAIIFLQKQDITLQSSET